MTTTIDHDGHLAAERFRTWTPIKARDHFTPTMYRAFMHYWETGGAFRYADHGHRAHPTGRVAEVLDSLRPLGIVCCTNNTEPFDD